MYIHIHVYVYIYAGLPISEHICLSMLEHGSESHCLLSLHQFFCCVYLPVYSSTSLCNMFLAGCQFACPCVLVRPSLPHCQFQTVNLSPHLLVRLALFVYLLFYIYPYAGTCLSMILCVPRCILKFFL